RCLVSRENDASWDNDASFSCWKTRRRLVRPLEDEATPCSPTGRQDGASSPHGEMRHRLIASFPRGDTHGTTR
ncbi:hypothetical protein BHE74_00053318, partial [Ensete ventricosum]